MYCCTCSRFRETRARLGFRRRRTLSPQVGQGTRPAKGLDLRGAGAWICTAARCCAREVLPKRFCVKYICVQWRCTPAHLSRTKDVCSCLAIQVQAIIVGRRCVFEACKHLYKRESRVCRGAANNYRLPFLTKAMKRGRVSDHRRVRPRRSRICVQG